MSEFDFENAPQLTPRATARIWVISDIQQSAPADALTTLFAAVDDVLSLGLELDAVWCLGDALRGPDEAALDEVADIFIKQLARLNLPVCYLLGNHDMDLKRVGGVDRYPLWTRARAEVNWHTMERMDMFYFARRFGETLVVFMGDHADPNGEWFTTHGGVSGKNPASYPHDEETYEEFSRALGEYPGPVMIAAHYAFPGGQKPAPLMARLLPLPANVKLSLHGHAHIGDLVWNKENPWERNNLVTGQTLRQINVSALETVRSPGSHSAILDLGARGPTALRIRCHQARAWRESYSLGE